MVKYYRHCPYYKCNLRCMNRSHHRANYANIKRVGKVKVSKYSSKINYYALDKLLGKSNNLKRTSSYHK